MQDCCMEIAIKKLLKTGFTGTALKITCELHKSKKEALGLLRSSDIERVLGRMVRKHEVKITGNEYPYHNPATPSPVYAINSQTTP